MDIATDCRQVTRLEIVDTGRQRHSGGGEAADRRGELSVPSPRQASATARRHGISNPLSFAWRMVRVGLAKVASGFRPAMGPYGAARKGPEPSGGGMEVVSVNRTGHRRARLGTWKRCFGSCAAWKRCNDPDSDGVRVWLATGHTDMHCAFPILLYAFRKSGKNSLSGHIFCFRGRKRRSPEDHLA